MQTARHKIESGYLIFLCTELELEAERASIVGRAVIHGSSRS